MIFVDDEMIME